MSMHLWRWRRSSTWRSRSIGAISERRRGRWRKRETIALIAMGWGYFSSSTSSLRGGFSQDELRWLSRSWVVIVLRRTCLSRTLKNFFEVKFYIYVSSLVNYSYSLLAGILFTLWRIVQESIQNKAHVSIPNPIATNSSKLKTRYSSAITSKLTRKALRNQHWTLITLLHFMILYMATG